jgi:hypothetical protein
VLRPRSRGDKIFFGIISKGYYQMIVAFFIFKWKVREGQILKAPEHISSRPSEDGTRVAIA